MKKRILALEPEAVGHESLFTAMQIAFNDADIDLVTIADLVEFGGRAQHEQWDALSVDFDIEPFMGMHPSEIESFVASARLYQEKLAVFFGTTSVAYLKKKLEGLGIAVNHKIYDVRQIAKVTEGAKRKEVTIEDIQKLVCDDCDIPYNEVLQKTRKREIVQARQITMYLAKIFTLNSLKTIGEHFGGRDHTTVIHSCQTVRDLMDTDAGFKNKVIMLRTKVALASGF